MERQNQNMICPKCGCEQEEASECIKCGVIVEKYFAKQIQNKNIDIEKSSPTSTNSVYKVSLKNKKILIAVCLAIFLGGSTFFAINTGDKNSSFRPAVNAIENQAQIKNETPKRTKKEKTELKIIKHTLWKKENFYFVKGEIFNPNERAAKNVVIKYYIWKKWMGQEGHGSMIRDTGGLVSAEINYLPSKQNVAFEAVGNGTAPTMTIESGLLPDPLEAEISTEWEE